MESETPSELKSCVLFALLQSGEAETICRLLPSLKTLNGVFPPMSEVARGLQVLHLLVRDRIKASLAKVEIHLDEKIQSGATEPAVKAEVLDVFAKILTQYPQ